MRQRNRRRFKRYGHPGEIPGNLKSRSDAKPTVIRAIAYGPDQFVEESDISIERLRELKNFPVLWVDIVGLEDIELVKELGKLFSLHALALEDIVNIQERPKSEEYPEHEFVVVKMLSYKERVEAEQFAICLCDKAVVTWQERPGDCLDPVRTRLRKGAGRIRSAGADYLAYALLDAIVDYYFPVIEKVGDRLEELEEKILSTSIPGTAVEIHKVKQDLITFRRAVWPLREAINRLTREQSQRINEQTSTYLRDCYDHTVQVIEMVETYREITSGLTDLHLSSISNRMNEIMQVLTVVATIFIPLTFIAGVYGMNFNPDKSPYNMPELAWYWGYPVCMALILFVGAVMVGLFWRAGWLKLPKR
jgi:magnesium transporter